MSGADSEVMFSVEEAPEGSALGHSILTEADDLDTLRDAVRDAARRLFEGWPAMLRSDHRRVDKEAP